VRQPCSKRRLGAPHAVPWAMRSDVHGSVSLMSNTCKMCTVDAHTLPAEGRGRPHYPGGNCAKWRRNTGSRRKGTKAVGARRAVTILRLGRCDGGYAWRP
jgi:hypothetical protein